MILAETPMGFPTNGWEALGLFMFLAFLGFIFWRLTK